MPEGAPLPMFHVHVTYLIIIAVTGFTHLTLYLEVTWYMVHSGTLYRIGRIIHGFENLIILTFSRQYTYYIWFILGKYYWIAPSGFTNIIKVDSYPTRLNDFSSDVC